jgi:hypothetical protein
MKQMEHNEQIINRLLKLWYELIGSEHHKDRDCWFFIEREYSTYKTPSWNVRHNGYILKDYSEPFSSFEKAQEGLIEFLAEACAKEISTIQENEANYPANEDFTINKLKELEKIIVDQHYISE